MPSMSGHDAEGEAERDWAILATEFFLHSMRDARAQAVMAEQYERARTLTAGMLAAKYAEAGAETPLPPRDLAIIIEAVGIGVTLQSLLDPGVRAQWGSRPRGSS